MKSRVDLLLLMTLLSAFVAWCGGSPALAESKPLVATGALLESDDLPDALRPPGAFKDDEGPSPVELARSAKSAVTRRSAAWTRVAIEVPPAGQKRAPTGTGSAQFGQGDVFTGSATRWRNRTWWPWGVK